MSVDDSLRSFRTVQKEQKGSEPAEPPLPSDAPAFPQGVSEEPDEMADYENEEPSSYECLQSHRRSQPLAPTNIDVEKFPNPLLKCGCGECEDHVNPLHGEDEGFVAQEECPHPKPVTIEEGAEVYRRTQIHNHVTNGVTSKASSHQYHYKKVLSTDVRLQEEWELTTALISLRLSPQKDGDWRIPWGMDVALNTAFSKVRRSLNYRLREVDKEYVAITEVTRWFATPHIHLYIWVDDPEDDIVVDDLRPVVVKHVDAVKGATCDGHQIDDDGEEGAIRLSHDPPLADEVEWDGENPTRGAIYTAKSLPHLPLLNLFDAGETCRQTSLEGGAMAWASPYDWFSSSRGVTA
jgi:hypothetical protein